MGDKIKIDIGLGKAAAINALGNMASQGIKSGTELQAQRRAQEHAKIEEIETFVFSSDYTEFAKQFLAHSFLAQIQFLKAHKKQYRPKSLFEA